MSLEALDAEALVALGRLQSQALSPDGTWIAACVHTLDADGAAYIGTIWRVPTDGGPATPLFESPFDDREPGFKRDGTLCFTSNRTRGDHTASEAPDPKTKRQLWAATEDGRLHPLTAEPLGVKAYRWARRADVLIVQTEVIPGVDHEEQEAAAKDLEKGPSILRYDRLPVRHWDHWIPQRVQHLIVYAQGERRDLTPDRTERFTEWSWDLSEDGRTIATIERVDGPFGIPSGQPVLIDVETGEARHLTAARHQSHSAPRLSPDGATLAVSRAEIERGRSLWDQLVLIPLADPGASRVLAGDWDASPTPVGWSRDGASLLVTVAERGRGCLVAVDVGSGQRHPLCTEGSVHGVSIDEDALFLRRSSYLHPPRLERLSLHTGERSPLAVLDALDDLSPHIHIEELEVEGAGGTPVQSFLLRPMSGGHGRTLLWIHGGPISDWADAWHWRWSAALAVAEGYTVVCPNPRGSLGFGRDFVEGIWGNVWGEACAEDLMKLTDALCAREDIDEDRIIAMGGSFGGYMTNWLGGQTDRYAALVTHASLFDFRAFHATTDHPPYWAFMLGLDPWGDAEALDRYNPRAFVKRWTTPTLVLHGDKDYRVPIGEGLALFTALQARGVESELVVFPDENHWILKPRNVVAWYESWLGFVERVVA